MEIVKKKQCKFVFFFLLIDVNLYVFNNYNLKYNVLFKLKEWEENNKGDS